MTFRDLIVLLPCQSLESLSLQREPQEANELLAGWSMLYHPLLVAHSEGVPRWSSADTPPEAPGESLIVVPPSVESQLPAEWAQRVEADGAKLLRHLHSRKEMVDAALALLPADAPTVDADLAADFLALGFCHLQVELLTRQLRYMSNLDEDRFRRHLKDAAQSALLHDDPSACEHLRSAFDRLTEAREYFYPVETYLFDLTLVASTTLGASLRSELQSGWPVNLLLSGALLDEMARREPATLDLLRESLGQGTVELVAAEYDERELPLLTREDVLAELQRGLECYQRHLGRKPTIYGRRRAGLTPILPSVLRSLGFDGALHFTLEDGRFPIESQSKIRWEGLDGSEIDAVARVPTDVRQSDAFLRLPERLGNSMDVDHAATMVFAHWAGQSSPWYEDLRRMADYCPVLGRFTLAPGYFQSTLHAGRVTRHEAEKYRSPYLRQDVDAHTPNPISRWVQYRRDRASADAAAAWNTLSDLVTGRVAASEDPLASPVPPIPANASSYDNHLARARTRLGSALGGRDAAASDGLLLVNPHSFRRRALVDVSALSAMPKVGGPVLLARQWEAAKPPSDQAVQAPSGEGQLGGGAAIRPTVKQVLVEVPPLGFAWVGPDKPGPQAPDQARRKPLDPPLAEGNQLRNEHFEITFDATTGAIQSIHNFAVRGNRMGQQIGMRLVHPAEVRRQAREPGAEDEYSIMAADALVLEQIGPLEARAVARGRLVDRKAHTLAEFVQTTRIQRGGRIITLEIELDPRQQPEADPWNSYYAARFAWADETATLARGVGLTRRPIDGTFLEAPDFIDLRAPRTQLTILPAGLPYHRRFGLRKLDSLLVVKGEQARRFRLAIGVDVGYCGRAAMDFLTADLLPALPWSQPPNRSGWLFHVDERNVLATQWETIAVDGRPKGLRVRLLETEGRAATADLACFRPPASARKTDLLGQRLAELPISGDRVTIDLAAHEWTQVEVYFS